MYVKLQITLNYKIEWMEVMIYLTDFENRIQIKIFLFRSVLNIMYFWIKKIYF